jgi:hypothetical protein
MECTYSIISIAPYPYLYIGYFSLTFLFDDSSFSSSSIVNLLVSDIPQYNVKCLFVYHIQLHLYSFSVQFYDCILAVFLYYVHQLKHLLLLHFLNSLCELHLRIKCHPILQIQLIKVRLDVIFCLITNYSITLLSLCRISISEWISLSSFPLPPPSYKCPIQAYCRFYSLTISTGCRIGTLLLFCICPHLYL